MNGADHSWAEAGRAGRRIGHAVEGHEAIGSTNDRARELLDVPGGAGTAVVAERQLEGRGRRGRTWTSPPGRNLTVSVAYRPHLRAADAWRIGLAVALAARGACCDVAPVDLKWPNDLVAANGRKVGGVLIETAVEGARVREAVLGIGINVNWAIDEMPAELAGSATSLAELSGTHVDRVRLLASLLERLDVELADIEDGASPLQRYRDACRTLGSHVTVEVGARTLEGRAVAIDDTGALVIDTPAGAETVSSGEVVRVRRPEVPA